MPTEATLEQPLPHFSHNSAANADKGYIDGWLDGKNVSLHYTKWFFCEEAPASGAASGCVIGADAEVYPRPGPMPTIYAIAAIGFSPDVATLACPAGSACLNHPAMLDASRVASNSPAVPHSHIITGLRAGWWHTMNIRVFDLGVWNQIAAAKSLTKVRELQADPAVGGAFSPHWAGFRANRWAQLDSTVVSPMGFDLAQTCINFKARVDSVINSKHAEFPYRNEPYKYHLLRYGPYWVAVLQIELSTAAWLMVFTKQTVQFLGDDMF